MTDTTQILLTACMATVLYTVAFMVFFDRLASWATKHDATASQQSAAPAALPAVRRPLRGLAAEPTVLPRTLSGVYRPITQQDDVMPGLLASLDRVPSTSLVMS